MGTIVRVKRTADIYSYMRVIERIDDARIKCSRGSGNKQIDEVLAESEVEVWREPANPAH